MAGMVCFRRGDRSRLIYSFRVHRGRKGEPKGFTWQDNRDLIVRAHNQLKGPIVLVRDNLRTHLMPQAIGNLAAANLDQLAAAVKRSLKKTQYRPHLIDGCLIGTGLTLTS